MKPMAGCFGAPCFNTLMGLGMGLVYRTFKDGVFKFQPSRSAPLGFIFAGVSLFFTALFVPFNGWRLSKRYAIVLLLIYTSFVLLNLLTEAGVVPVIRLGNQ